jgi:hypothetical protein
LYLEPAFGGGIGEIVFEKLKMIAKQNDCINIQWQTPVFNERAIKFYNRIGGRGKTMCGFLQIHKARSKDAGSNIIGVYSN